jgi:hypothetical protein
MANAAKPFVNAFIAPSKDAVALIDKQLGDAGFIRFNERDGHTPGWHHADGSWLKACEVTKGPEFLGFVLTERA